MKALVVILIIAAIIGVGLLVKHMLMPTKKNAEQIGEAQPKEEKAKILPASEWQSILPGKWGLHLVETSENETVLVKGQMNLYPDGKFHMYITNKYYSGKHEFYDYYNKYTETGERAVSGGDASGRWLLVNNALKFTDIQCNISVSHRTGLGDQQIGLPDCNFFQTTLFGNVSAHHYVTTVERFNKDIIKIGGNNYNKDAKVDYVFNRIGDADYSELTIADSIPNPPATKIDTVVKVKKITVEKEPVDEDAPPYGVISAHRAVVYTRYDYDKSFDETRQVLPGGTKVNIAKAYKGYYYCEFSYSPDSKITETGWIRKKDVTITKSDAQLELEKLFPPKKD